jgi:hypothetical protein
MEDHGRTGTEAHDFGRFHHRRELAPVEDYEQRRAGGQRRGEGKFSTATVPQNTAIFSSTLATGGGIIRSAACGSILQQSGQSGTGEYRSGRLTLRCLPGSISVSKLRTDSRMDTGMRSEIFAGVRIGIEASLLKGWSGKGLTHRTPRGCAGVAEVAFFCRSVPVCAGVSRLSSMGSILGWKLAVRRSRVRSSPAPPILPIIYSHSPSMSSGSPRTTLPLGSWETSWARLQCKTAAHCVKYRPGLDLESGDTTLI